MPKFANGEFALVRITPKEHARLQKYNGEIVEIVEFTGTLPSSAGLSCATDWYVVRATVDETLFCSREVSLRKLPNEHTPADMNTFWETHCPNVKKKLITV